MLALVVSVFTVGCNGGGGGGFDGIKTKTDTVSYAIGMDIGKNFQTQNIEVNAAALKQGLQDFIDGAAQFTDDDVMGIMRRFQNELRQKDQAKKVEDAAANKQKGAQFLAENSTKEGVVTLPSGLQYKVITPGTGASPTLDDKVKCHYRGTLIGGKEFDSSYSRGEPAVFPLRGVIKAWQEAVQLMKEGGKWEIYAPSDLAYGDMGSPPNIGPGETLIFEIELLEVNPAE